MEATNPIKLTYQIPCTLAMLITRPQFQANIEGKAYLVVRKAAVKLMAIISLNFSSGKFTADSMY